MPITVNEGGTLYELDTITSNEGGTLYELDTITSNEGGTLYEIHSGKLKVTWTSYGSSYATILSTGSAKNKAWVTFTANFASMGSTPDVIKGVFSLKAGQKVVASWEINNTGPTSSGSPKLYSSSGKLLSDRVAYYQDGYTANADYINCYITFPFRKLSSSTSATVTFTITIS